MAKAVRQKDINLLLAIDNVKEKREVPKTVFAGLLIIAIFAILSLIFFSAAFILRSGTQAEIDRINAFINNPDTISKISASAEMATSANQMKLKTDSLAAPLLILDGHPLLVSNDIKTAIKLAGAAVKVGGFKYSSETGLLEFTAQISGKNTEALPYYISQLRNSGVFLDVTYRGYNQELQAGNTTESSPSANSSNTGADTPKPKSEEAYSHDSFDIQCLVKPRNVINQNLLGQEVLPKNNGAQNGNS